MELTEQIAAGMAAEARRDRRRLAIRIEATEALLRRLRQEQRDRRSPRPARRAR